MQRQQNINLKQTHFKKSQNKEESSHYTVVISHYLYPCGLCSKTQSCSQDTKKTNRKADQNNVLLHPLLSLSLSLSAFSLSKAKQSTAVEKLKCDPMQRQNEAKASRESKSTDGVEQMTSGLKELQERKRATLYVKSWATERYKAIVLEQLIKFDLHLQFNFTFGQHLSYTHFEYFSYST